VVDDPCDFDGEPLSEGQIFGNPDLVQLTTRINPFRGERFSIDVGLVYINSTIHEEAAAVLYGRNTFQFVGEYSWINFFYFHRRLTRVGRPHLRQLEIGFPDIERFNTTQIVGQLDEFGEKGIKILKHLPSLGDLTFRIGEDIMAADIELLRRIRDACQRQCRIVMDIRKALLYHDPDGFDDRPVRISSSAIQKTRKWGWDLRGQYELVDQHHRLRKETSWLRWLQRNRQKGLQSGLISEPNPFSEAFMFC